MAQVEKFQVLVTPDGRDGITLRWLVPITDDDAMKRRLEAYLKKLHGVENVHVMRYGAQLVIASHVTDITQVAKDVGEVMESLATRIQALVHEPVQMDVTVVLR